MKSIDHPRTLQTRDIVSEMAAHGNPDLAFTANRIRTIIEGRVTPDAGDVLDLFRNLHRAVDSTRPRADEGRQWLHDAEKVLAARVHQEAGYLEHFDREYFKLESLLAEHEADFGGIRDRGARLANEHRQTWRELKELLVEHAAGNEWTVVEARQAVMDGLGDLERHIAWERPGGPGMADQALVLPETMPELHEALCEAQAAVQGTTWAKAPQWVRLKQVNEALQKAWDSAAENLGDYFREVYQEGRAHGFMKNITARASRAVSHFAGALAVGMENARMIGTQQRYAMKLLQKRSGDFADQLMGNRLTPTRHRPRVGTHDPSTAGRGSSPAAVAGAGFPGTPVPPASGRRSAGTVNAASPDPAPLKGTSGRSGPSPQPPGLG
jgi:hypothetical protein